MKTLRLMKLGRELSRQLKSLEKPPTNKVEQILKKVGTLMTSLPTKAAKKVSMTWMMIWREILMEDT